MEDFNGLEKRFVAQHKLQLENSGVPKHLWPTVFKKLQGQVRKWSKMGINLGGSQAVVSLSSLPLKVQESGPSGSVMRCAEIPIIEFQS